MLKKPKNLKLANQKPTIKELDGLCREVVRLRDKKCVVCGSTRYLQVMHFISRQNYAVRWDMDNVYFGCSGCHIMRKDSWHKNPATCTEWVLNRLGEEKYYALKLRASNKAGDKQLIKIYLEQEMKKYGKTGE